MRLNQKKGNAYTVQVNMWRHTSQEERPTLESEGLVVVAIWRLPKLAADPSIQPALSSLLPKHMPSPTNNQTDANYF